MLLKTYNDAQQFFNHVDIIFDINNELEYNLTRVQVSSVFSLIKPGVLVKQLQRDRWANYGPITPLTFKPTFGIVLWIIHAEYKRCGQIGILWNS